MDFFSRPNISKPFKLQNDCENRQGRQPRGGSAAFLICFLFTLPYQQDRCKTPPRLPGRDGARAVRIGGGPIVTRHATRPYKDRPLCLPALREGGREKVRGKNKSTKADDGMFEASKEKSHMVVKGGGQYYGGKLLGKPPKHTLWTESSSGREPDPDSLST